MQPIALRQKPSTIALKKRPIAERIIDSKGETQGAEILDHKEAKNEESRQHLVNTKEKEKFVETDYHKVDGLERSELEENYPHSEDVDDGIINVGMEDHQEAMEFEEEHKEERIVEDEMIEDMIESEEEEDNREHDGGYEHIEEVYGDEEEHHVVNERRKRKEFEIFVGGLDRDAIEEDLLKVFSQVGDVTEVRLMKNPLTQKNKGFAFVRFATAEQARRAVKELKHTTVNGKHCGVAPSQDSDTLFIGNICKTWTKEVFKERLAQYGVHNFEDLTLVEDAKNVGMNRGFAFLDFSTRTDALDACKHLQKMDVLFGTDRIAKVAFADTFIEPDDEIMAQVKKVFIDGLHAAWDEDHVRQHLGKFGKIEMIELARNMPAAKRTDFGFVTFDTHDAAVACVEGINNAEICDGDNKVKVRARLTRPRQRGKPGHHARGGYLDGRGGQRGARASRSSGMPLMNSWRFSSHGGEDRKYSGGFNQSLGPRGRYTSINLASDRVERRRTLPPLERSFDQRSPGPAYRKSTSKREHIYPDAHFPRRSDFAPRVPAERHLSFRDVYPSRGSAYMESPSQSDSRGAAYRPPPPYFKERYGRRIEQSSSYHDGHSQDYGSGSKRPHSSVEEFHSHYSEPTHRQPRAHLDYRGANGDTAYLSDSRLERGSHLEYDGRSRNSAGHSRVYNARTPTIGYTRDEISRGDTGRLYSSYDRDFISPGTHDEATSYSSAYSSRRMDDGYANGRGPRTYY